MLNLTIQMRLKQIVPMSRVSKLPDEIESSRSHPTYNFYRLL